MVFDAPPDALVDDMGGIVWTPALYYEPDDDSAQTPDFTPIGYNSKELFRFLKGKRIEPPKG